MVMAKTKWFTVDEANATLPLVRRIVEDVVVQHRLWRARVDEVDLLAASGRASDVADMARIEAEILSLAGEIDGFRRELAELGIQLKDPALGLVDFPSRIGNRPILLCWRLGEPDIGFWHDEHTGYAGRQPLLSGSPG
jgi:hypothetical protein